MALATIIAGRYSGSLTPAGGSPTDVGVTDSPGYKIGFMADWELINESDAYGANVIEMIWRGFSDVGVAFVSKEYKNGPTQAMLPVMSYAVTGAVSMTTGLIGRRGTDIVGSLVLTALAATPAASTPATLTFTQCLPREGFRVEWFLDTKGRKAPVDLRIMPITDGANGCKYWLAS